MVIELERPVVFRDLVPEIPSTTYATFGLYKYPAKFIPQVIAYALRTFAEPGMSVFDPFGGYGTVGVVARLYGNDYELWDLNPLLSHLHPIAVMNPIEIDLPELLRRLKGYDLLFQPDWSNMGYWYPEMFSPMLQKAWGFYHSLNDCDLKRVLLIPLLKTTRYFSLNDDKRQKLSQSPLSRMRITKLQERDWEEVFYDKILTGVEHIIRGLNEYQGLTPAPVNATVRAGVDTFTTELSHDHDILLTSPPYLQAQEYIRSCKMDLFWLGYPESQIKILGKTEFPYREVPRIPIHSNIYNECLKEISEPHMIRMFEQYFCGVLGSLSRLQEHITGRLLLFVGPATVRNIPIPIDRIFIEHLETLGWNHKATLIDTIVSRSMFFYDANPATGSNDKRMSTEHLVVLSRR
ncbi:MAG: hypothetical protein JW856_04055 [Dehalococcoidales bacterium]|nr:hypothetical protein [Dehalococcoidales bacterium]